MDPVNLVDISSDLFVSTVSQFAHENSLVPPICSRNTRPILDHWVDVTAWEDGPVEHIKREKMPFS